MSDDHIPAERSLAVVTGASTGIGYELALVCARNGFDLAVAADEPRIHEAAQAFRQAGAERVEAVEADLATIEGNEKLYASAQGFGRPIEVLFANVGRGLGHAFLDQDFEVLRRVVDTNVTGTLYIIHRIGRDMRQRGAGRILITGSIAGYIPGSFQAVYNGTKAFLDSFAFAIRDETKDDGITVTVLEPGATDTEFFRRAGMTDTAVATGSKDDPVIVAQKGFDALMAGDGDIVTGIRNKLQTVMANVTPAAILAAQHRKQAAPGTAKS
jgi:short-subunit dehydrogenase